MIYDGGYNKCKRVNVLTFLLYLDKTMINTENVTLSKRLVVKRAVF